MDSFFDDFISEDRHLTSINKKFIIAGSIQLYCNKALKNAGANMLVEKKNLMVVDFSK